MDKESIKSQKQLLMMLSLPEESLERLKKIAELYKKTPKTEKMNYNDVITKEQALEIAKEIVPDLENRRYYKISSEKPRKAYIFRNVPEHCWYITYSQMSKDSDIYGLFSSNEIIINKFNGKVVYQGSLREEG